METMSTIDPFGELARYYDGIMADINYDRWILVAARLGLLLEKPRFRHLDVGCGTGKLVKRLKRDGWSSFGVDLSWGMVRTGRAGGVLAPLAQGDMVALPFANSSIDLVTCLFDSLNFLLDPRAVEQAIQEFQRVLTPDGIVYFDLVTERMVTEHFADQKWTEDNGRFTTTWHGSYDRGQQIADTSICVNTGAAALIRERIYPIADVTRWVENAGLNALGMFDGETWRSVSRRTIRADFVATRSQVKRYAREFKKVVAEVRGALQ